MADVKVDFKDVWNAVTDVVKLMDSDTTVQMTERAFVVPKGLQPMDLQWDSGQEHRIWDTFSRTSICSRNLWCDETNVRVGVIWSFGGTYQGWGRYLHDAYMFAVPDSTAFAESISATGQFSATPVLTGNAIATLEGSIHIQTKQFKFNYKDYFWDFTIQGDGAGHIARR